MKYYIYISDTKVDMLYPQIPKSILKKIASSLNIDLKLLGLAEVNVGAKNSQANETRYAKVKIVSEYIEKHLDVGSVDAPSTYFKGRLSMRQGTFKDQAAYFGGETAFTVLGLCGSIKHVIGNNTGAEIQTFNSSLYAFEIMIEEMISEAKLTYDNRSEDNEVDEEIELNALAAILYITKEQRGNKQQFEFLAKTLLQGPLPLYGHPYIVLGTPIYVAIDD